MATRFLKTSSNGNKILKSKLMTAPSYMIIFNFSFLFSIVAKDRANFGQVNSATTGLLIKVQDIEDKPPEFVSVPSVTRIAEDVPTFTEVR